MKSISDILTTVQSFDFKLQSLDFNDSDGHIRHLSHDDRCLMLDKKRLSTFSVWPLGVRVDIETGERFIMIVQSLGGDSRKHIVCLPANIPRRPDVNKCPWALTHPGKWKVLRQALIDVQHMLPVYDGVTNPGWHFIANTWIHVLPGSPWFIKVFQKSVHPAACHQKKGTQQGWAKAVEKLVEQNPRVGLALAATIGGFIWSAWSAHTAKKTGKMQPSLVISLQGYHPEVMEACASVIALPANSRFSIDASSTTLGGQRFLHGLNGAIGAIDVSYEIKSSALTSWINGHEAKDPYTTTILISSDSPITPHGSTDTRRFSAVQKTTINRHVFEIKKETIYGNFSSLDYIQVQRLKKDLQDNQGHTYDLLMNKISTEWQTIMPHVDGMLQSNKNPMIECLNLGLEWMIDLFGIDVKKDMSPLILGLQEAH